MADTNPNVPFIVVNGELLMDDSGDYPILDGVEFSIAEGDLMAVGDSLPELAISEDGKLQALNYFNNNTQKGEITMADTNPNPSVAFAGLFNHIGLELDARLAQEMASLTNLHDVDFAALGQNIADLMAATDGDDTQSGFQILESLRSDLNAVMAKATGNESAIAALSATVSNLNTTLTTYVDTKVAALQSAIDGLDTRVTANAAAVQAETQRAMTKETALESRIATNETAVSGLNDGLVAEVSARQAEKVTTDAAIAANATAITDAVDGKLDVAWATDLIASTTMLKAAFDAGMAGNTYTV